MHNGSQDWQCCPLDLEAMARVAARTGKFQGPCGFTGRSSESCRPVQALKSVMLWQVHEVEDQIVNFNELTVHYTVMSVQLCLFTHY